MSEWRAVVIGPGGDHSDPLSQTAQLFIYSRSPMGDLVQVVTGDLIVRTAPEGTAQPKGLILQPEMLEPIREAIERMNGRPETNYQTEVKVLREMLKIEQDRVDWQMGRNR